jgi:hypothetical protein
MDMKKQSFLILSILWVASGCSLYNIDSEDTTTSFYTPKTSPQEVQYLRDLDQPHETIGHVTINAERNQRMTEVLEQMKREAAIMGGDAITNIQSDTTGMWKKLPVQKFVGNAYIRSNFKADVVVLK